jgi:hypothetical protein
LSQGRRAGPADSPASTGDQSDFSVKRIHTLPPIGIIQPRRGLKKGAIPGMNSFRHGRRF